MAYTTNQTLNVRIKNKYDTYENWVNSSVKLEAGEIAIAYTTVNVKVGNGTAKHPALLMKVGDGESSFASLPWLSAKAADVLEECKDSAELTKFINGVIAEAGVATDDALATLSGRVKTLEEAVDEDTKYQIVADGTNGFKLQKKGATDSAWSDVSGSSFKVDFSGIEATIAEELAKYDDRETVEGKIAVVNTALENYKTSNNAAVEANTSAINGIKNGTSINTFGAVETALAGKQAAGDYATKTEAQGYADAKNEAIAAAKTAGDNAQAYAEALAGKVGTVADNTTVVDMIGAVQDDVDAKDEAINAKVDGLETAMGNLETTLEAAISEEVAKEELRATGAEEALGGRIDAIVADYLKAADKKSLQDQIDLIMDNPNTENVKDSIAEFTAYIAEHGTIAEGFRTDIDKNKDDISAIAADYLKAEHQTALQGNIDAVAGRVTTAEGKITALEGSVATKAAQSDLAALEAKAATKTELEAAQAQIAEDIAALNVDQYATDAELEVEKGRIGALETSVGALANIAKTGNVADLVQTENTYIVFDCGSASVLI